jgi:hypothetical protein
MRKFLIAETQNPNEPSRHALRGAAASFGVVCTNVKELMFGNGSDVTSRD